MKIINWIKRKLQHGKTMREFKQDLGSINEPNWIKRAFTSLVNRFSGRDRLKEVSQRLEEYERASSLSPDEASTFEEDPLIEGSLELGDNHHNKKTPGENDSSEEKKVFYRGL